MKFLAVIVFSISTASMAFWGNTNTWSPFGTGTGYNNPAPWGNNSNWNPFTSGASGQWSPKNDAANLSRFGAKPPVLMQYKKDPRFQPNYYLGEFQNQVQPSNWLRETDFASTLEQVGSDDKSFTVGDFSIFGLSDSYARAKAETLGLGRVLRDHAVQHSNSVLGDKSTIYGKQGYALSPAASSTEQIKKDK